MNAQKITRMHNNAQKITRMHNKTTFFTLLDRVTEIAHRFSFLKDLRDK